jgi:hypothetical protein
MANRRRLRENEFHKPQLTAGQFRNRDEQDFRIVSPDTEHTAIWPSRLVDLYTLLS